MDADDIAKPERLARQVEFLERHPDVGIVGTGYDIIDAAGNVTNHYEPPTTDLAIRWRCLVNNPFAHPTVTLRADLLRGQGFRYDERLAAAQDYDLWSRLLAVTRGANLLEPLMAYRAHPGSVTATRRAQQERITAEVAVRNVRDALRDWPVSSDDIIQLNRLLAKDPQWWAGLHARAAELLLWYAKLFHAFAARHAGEDGLAAIRRRVAYTIASIALEPPVAPGWRRVVQAALRLDPLLPAVLAVRLPAAAVRRWRSTP